MVRKLVLVSFAFCVLSSSAASFPPAATVAAQKAAASFLAAHSRGLKSTKLGAATRIFEDALTKHGRALRSRNLRAPDAPISVTASQSACQWNSAEAECELSDELTAAYLNRLNDDYTSYIAQFPTCEGAKTKSTCHKAGHCVWDSQAKKCFFVDFIKGQEDSPCFKAAPGSLSLFASLGVCAPAVSEAKCNEEPSCTWDDVGDSCIVDPYQIYYGFTAQEVSKEIEKLSEVWVEELVEDYSFFESPEFKWSDLLEWKGPDEACTPDASPAVCDFLGEGFIPLLPNIYYCAFKYSEGYKKEECSKDLRCQMDSTGSTCGPSTDSAAYMFRSTLEQIDSEMDRGLLKDALACTEIPKKKCKGKCYWSVEGDGCAYSDTALFDKIAAVDTSGEDTLCRFIQAVADSDCLTIQHGERCSVLDKCTWTTIDQTCMPSSEYLAGGVRSSTNSGFTNFRNQCSKHETIADCLSVVV